MKFVGHAVAAAFSRVADEKSHCELHLCECICGTYVKINALYAIYSRNVIFNGR